MLSVVPVSAIACSMMRTPTGLVVGRLAVALGEAGREALRRVVVEGVVPQALPMAGERFDARRPERHCVHDPARKRVVQVVLGVLLEKRGLIDAGEVDVHEVRVRLPDLEDIGTVIRGIGRHHVVAEI
jgi:hypothetical protein